MDIMGEDLYKHHKEIYKPWYEVASKVLLPRRAAGSTISIAALTFKILVEDCYPEQLDEQWALVKGSGLRGFKAGLSAYFDPIQLWAFDKPANKAVANSK